MTGILLPDEYFNIKRIDIILKTIKDRFNDKVIFFSFDFLEFKEINSIKIKTKNQKIYFKKEKFIKFIKKYTLDRLVITKRDDDNNPDFTWDSIEFPIYRDVYCSKCGLRSVNRSEVYEKNNFNPLFSGDNEWMQLYPYNYFHSVQDITQIDNYGFRKQKIDKSKKLIIIVGGSGGFDLCSLKKETFYYKLNKLVGKKYQVINFSLPGYVLLNQYFLYILYLQKLNPYMIISYDGVNDFLNGLKNDESLLKYNINYTNSLHNFSEKIYNKNNIYKCASLEQIAQAYSQRKQQFFEVVSSNKIKFISILQPLVYSKQSLSEKEIKTKDENLTKIYQQIQDGYDLLPKFDFPHLNLHKEFNKFNGTDTLFYKEIYQLSNANQFIAMQTYNFIKEFL